MGKKIAKQYQQKQPASLHQWRRSVGVNNKTVRPNKVPSVRSTPPLLASQYPVYSITTQPVLPLRMVPLSFHMNKSWKFYFFILLAMSQVVRSYAEEMDHTSQSLIQNSLESQSVLGNQELNTIKNWLAQGNAIDSVFTLFDTNSQTNMEMTPLAFSVLKNNVDATKYFLAQGASPVVKHTNDQYLYELTTNEEIQMLLFKAARGKPLGSVTVINDKDMILSIKVYEEAVNHKREVALFDDAVGIGNEAQALELLAENPTLARYFAPTWTASTNKMYRLLRLMLAYGVPADSVPHADTIFLTMLRNACANGNVKIADILLSAGADPNRIDVKAYMPYLLHVTNHNKIEMSKQTRLEITKLLLEHGARVNVVNKEGNTPLQQATQNIHLELMELLLKHDANLEGSMQKAYYEGLLGEAPDYTNLSPLQIAVAKKFTEGVRLLLASGASVIPTYLGTPISDLTTDAEIKSLLQAHLIKYPLGSTKGRPAKNPILSQLKSAYAYRYEVAVAALALASSLFGNKRLKKYREKAVKDAQYSEYCKRLDIATYQYCQTEWHQLGDHFELKVPNDCVLLSSEGRKVFHRHFNEAIYSESTIRLPLTMLHEERPNAFFEDIHRKIGSVVVEPPTETIFNNQMMKLSEEHSIHESSYRRIVNSIQKYLEALERKYSHLNEIVASIKSDNRHEVKTKYATELLSKVKSWIDRESNERIRLMHTIERIGGILRGNTLSLANLRSMQEENILKDTEDFISELFSNLGNISKPLIDDIKSKEILLKEYSSTADNQIQKLGKIIATHGQGSTRKIDQKYELWQTTKRENEQQKLSLIEHMEEQEKQTQAMLEECKLQRKIASENKIAALKEDRANAKTSDSNATAAVTNHSLFKPKSKYPAKRPQIADIGKIHGVMKKIHEADKKDTSRTSQLLHHYSLLSCLYRLLECYRFFDEDDHTYRVLKNFLGHHHQSLEFNDLLELSGILSALDGKLNENTEKGSIPSEVTKKVKDSRCHQKYVIANNIQRLAIDAVTNLQTLFGNLQTLFDINLANEGETKFNNAFEMLFSYIGEEVKTLSRLRDDGNLYAAYCLNQLYSHPELKSIISFTKEWRDYISHSNQLKVDTTKFDMSDIMGYVEAAPHYANQALELLGGISFITSKSGLRQNI